MSAFKKSPKAEPLTDIEAIAAGLLVDLYIARVQKLVDGQVKDERPNDVILSFSERLHLDRAVAAMRKAQDIAIKRAMRVAVVASDEAKVGSKEQRVVEAMLEEMRGMLTAEDPASTQSIAALKARAK